MKVTPAMIGAAHDVTMNEAGIILSHDLISKIYEAMQAQAAPSDDWSRALRLADDAAESVICTEGHSPAAYHWVLTHEQIAACDPDTIRELLEERDALREVLQVLVNCIPSADTYRRFGFNPEVPMRAHDEAKAILKKGNKA